MSATTSMSKVLIGWVVLGVCFTMVGCGGMNTSSTSTPPAVAVSLNQASVTLGVGATTQFSATVQNTSNTAVTWSVDTVAGGNSTVGTISSSGLYTAPSQAGNHTVTATSVADTTKNANAVVTVGMLAAITPASVTIPPGGTEQFNTTVQGFSNTSVNWAVDTVVSGNATVGTITSAGLYTAPSQAGPHTVTATSVADSSLSANASVTVAIVATLAVSPTTAAINPSTTEQFTASIQGVTTTAITWSVDTLVGGNASVGTITPTGLYTAPSTIGLHTIEAISSADSSLTASASITVINYSQASVLTYHNDDARDGAYTEEVTLTPSNVNSTTFGKLLAYPVDGQIYAQPLYMYKLNIAGATHDVVFVETQNNSVYAFDADATAASPTTFWQRNFGTPVNANDSGGPAPNVGILSTPVIDAGTNTMYLVVENPGSNGPAFSLHALNVTTGQDQANSPAAITATYPGTGADSSGGTLTLAGSGGCYQRMGLALNPVSNAIYMAFGSCDHGWVLAYDKTSLAQTAAFNDTPDGEGGGLWASGGAPAIDDATGDLYLMSGVDEITYGAPGDPGVGDPVNTGYNDSFMRLDPNSLNLLDYFTPADNYYLAEWDADLGSGADILVPSPSSVPMTIGGGKDGNVFVVNRSNMGGYNPNGTGPGGTNTVIQTVQVCNDGFNNIFSTPVYWNGAIYYHCNDNVIQAFSWNANSATAPLSTSPIASGNVTYTKYHGATPSLSSNGATNGIIWDIDNSNYETTGTGTQPCVLHAYDATNLNELYNSSQAANGRDTAGYALKFTLPTIANGRVFVPTSNELDIYGPLQ
jgi:hypothetical protein